MALIGLVAFKEKMLTTDTQWTGPGVNRFCQTELKNRMFVFIYLNSETDPVFTRCLRNSITIHKIVKLPGET